MELMTGKVRVVIEEGEHGCYAWCPELKGCQSEGKTIEESLANIREAIELFLETLSEEERSAALSRETFSSMTGVCGILLAPFDGQATACPEGGSVSYSAPLWRRMLPQVTLPLVTR